MKKLIPFLILIIFIPSCAPKLITLSEGEYFINVYDSPDTKDQLFLKANEWMISQFRDATSVIQHSDKAEGVIIGKYLMFGEYSSSMYGSSDNRVYAIIDIRVKDNKARLEIKPQPWKYNKYNEYSIYSYSKDNSKSDMNKLAESFSAYLQKKNVEF